MITTIDRAGRVVIPKRLREALNLDPGAEIDIEPAPDGLLLRAAGQGSRLAEKRGFLVHRGGGGEIALEVADFINRQREGRAAGSVRVP
jgi:AbrB family looped-hinge helix DNA binding protein